MSRTSIWTTRAWYLGYFLQPTIVFEAYLAD
jgi:hypothetical protein